MVFSIALHLFMVFAFLPHAATLGMTAGGGVGEGSGAGDGTAVEMFDGRLPDNKNLKIKEPQPEDGEDVTTAALAAVDDMQLSEVTSELPQSVDDKLPDAPKPQLASADDNAAHMGATGTGGLTQGDGDDLWAAIAPCWRRMSDDTTLPVDLIVTFGPDGGLAVPPVIDRDPKAPLDSQRLISESRAIQALAACGAYPMAANRENVKILFPHM